MDNELHVLYSKRDATLRRYKRTGDRTSLEEFLRLRREATDTTKNKQTNYIHDRLKKTLNNNGNFWEKLRGLDLLHKSADGLHDLSLNELNDHFAVVSCSSTESCNEAIKIINTAPDEGFIFKHVLLSDVILAVDHLTS